MSYRHCISFLCFLVALVYTAEAEIEYPDTPGVVYGAVNANIVIPCDLAFPQNIQLAVLMWYKGSTYILYKGEDGIIKFRDDSVSEKYDMIGDNNTLAVNKVSQGDGGNYTCKATYKHLDGIPRVVEINSTQELIVQEDASNFTVEVDSGELDDNITLYDDVPSQPGQPQITEITSRSVVVSWEKSHKDNNSPIIYYLIYIKEIIQEWSDSRVLQVTGSTTSIKVHDLKPYAAYQIQIVAKNALGNSLPSSQSDIIMTLSEEPSEAPVDLIANETKNTSIHIAWEKPPEGSINGIPGGYKVKYGKVTEIAVFVFTIEDYEKTSTIIENLSPYTTYQITVTAFNDISDGPDAVLVVQTKEGVPDKPRIIQYDQQTAKSFRVLWEAPKILNGKLKHYELQWIHNNTYKTRIITGVLTKPLMHAKILKLAPYTQYQLRVRAMSGGGYSEYSDLYPAITDVQGPSAPELLNLTVLSPRSIFVHWKPPTKYYKKIDYFYIHYWSLPNKDINTTLQIKAEKAQTIIADIETNHEYKLKIAGMTQSIFSQENIKGNFTEEVQFNLEDPSVVTYRVKVAVNNGGVIAGIVVAVLFVAVAILLFVGYRSMTCRKYTRSLYYLAVPTNSQSPQSTVVFPPETIEDTKYQEIRVPDFLHHVRSMHADGDNGFSVEFDDITSRTRTDLTADASFLPENKGKNRYVNISAFDHTRVILQPIPGKLRSSDYINGNFIDGYNKPNAYIATQGPLPHTFADFWRMIWEQGSVVIIMITNLMERGRRKCDMYWPEEGTESYGLVTVKHLNTFSRAHYTVRMFSLKSSKIKKKHVVERIVYQYHYTEWPDHGVPEFTLPVLKFIQKSSHENPPGAGPIIIHCSAGVGRTGTYILIESMIKQIIDKGTVNIPGFLLHIRQQRNFMVQTEEQYMLIHDAIAEYILTHGDTEIRECDVPKYTVELTKQLNGELTSLDIQYALVTNFSPKPDDMFHALKSVNVSKNRNLEMLPLSVKRVVLPMKPGVEGSDYINATYLQGYNKSNEFIITQHPLDQTIEDFWRMVWDQNSSVIVQLSDTDDNEFKTFWPDRDCTFDIGCFKLVYREDDDRRSYKIREFLLQSNQDDYILMTRIVTPKSRWPDSCHPLHKVFDLVETAHDLHKQNDIGPVIIVDRYGGEEAATFSALWAVFDQLQYDKAINVYQLAKLYHLKRAGIIGSKEKYLYLYQAAESLSREWSEKDKQSSPGSVRLQLGSAKRNGTMPRSVTINSKVETDV